MRLAVPMMMLLARRRRSCISSDRLARSGSRAATRSFCSREPSRLWTARTEGVKARVVKARVIAATSRLLSVAVT
jgi:hypothetical protein